jgi:hypothetical protein
MKNRKLQQILNVLVLSSVLVFLTGIVGIKFYNAAADAISADRIGAIELISTSVDSKQETINKYPRQSRLPDSVASAVLQDAVKRSKLNSNQLRIIKAESKNWPDGCLGLSSPDIACTQIVVSGWQVTVTGKGRNFVYRTDDSGSLVKFEK